eukprot:TRINITY_DN102078_c0_g1_i1.p1 TRINITY_DN102078_c0_g1~~TRINITY_DN102078_c0_g1_i1.p1  ORF type:complete len:1047 (-),score=177.39 TRINITY_DN102078_c0_g1_i1:192-2882(-)
MVVFLPHKGRCPEECPYLRAVVLDEEGDHTPNSCKFRCVDKCTNSIHPSGTSKFDTADDEKFCRAGRVPGCREYLPASEGKDSCRVCETGYQLQHDGTCGNTTERIVWIVLFALIAFLLVGVVVYLILLFTRPVTNAETFKLAHKEAVQRHLHDPSTGVDYPLWTNLHKELVSGPGMALHMNFEVMLILWAFGVILIWIGACCYAPLLLHVGLSEAPDVVSLCTAIHQGRKNKADAMFAKSIAVILIYIWTTTNFLGFALFNRRRYCVMHEDADAAFHYCLRVSGFPEENGEAADGLEQECLDFVSSCAPEYEPVGVAICWDLSDDGQFEEVCEVSQQEREACEGLHREVTSGCPDEQVPAGAEVDRLLLDLMVGSAPPQDTKNADSVTKLLRDIKSSGTIHVIYKTEQERDAVLSKIRVGNYKFRGQHLVHAEEMRYEPTSVHWRVDPAGMPWPRLLGALTRGALRILACILVWGVVFYLPYAYFEGQNSVAGVEPSFWQEALFTVIVLCGNLALYTLCFVVADGVGFRFLEQTNSLYVVLYTIANLVQILLDMAIIVCMVYALLVRKEMRTVEGALVSSLASTEEVFKTFAFQKIATEKLFDYLIPSTFILPFAAEPLTIIVPFFLMGHIVKTNKSVGTREATKAVALPEYDMNRYGDLMVNVLLAPLVLFGCSGYVLRTFAILLFAHIAIYMYDQVRLLRLHQYSYFATNEVDNAVQVLSALPCGILAACVVWHLLGYHGLSGADEVVHAFTSNTGALRQMALVFTVHVVVHWGILSAMTAVVGVTAHDEDKLKQTYEDVSRRHPPNWFNMNVVHSLRTKYIHAYDPPIVPYSLGKHYLLQVNPSLGQYYSISDEQSKLPRCAKKRAWGKLKAMKGIGGINGLHLKAAAEAAK